MVSAGYLFFKDFFCTEVHFVGPLVTGTLCFLLGITLLPMNLKQRRVHHRFLNQIDFGVFLGFFPLVTVKLFQIVTQVFGIVNVILEINLWSWILIFINIFSGFKFLISRSYQS